MTVNYEYNSSPCFPPHSVESSVASPVFLHQRRSVASAYDMSHAEVRRRPHVVPEIAKHAAAELDYSHALCCQSAGA